MIFGRSVSVVVVVLAASMAAQFGHAGFRSNAVGVVAYPPTGVDTDGDGTDDANDTDIDGDGLVNSIPLPLPTDADACPYLSDCDFDGLADADDGAPQNPDVDGDGVLDGADPDIDGDGIANAADSDSFDSSIGGDTDGDGYDDAREVADGTDPNVDQTVLDTDGDGTNDHAEILAGTDPNVNELTAIAQFGSTPFTVDCTTTPGTCVVTGTVPTNATSVTVNGAQTGTSATSSQVATISGGQFTATFIGLDHTASWDFTATASGGTGVTDVVSAAVAMTPTQPPVIAQFASTPFSVDCTTTPGTCIVTGAVPTNATSVTVNGAQTGTSATSSQIATISGGQFTATFIGLDHTASWDFTATASGGTGVTDVLSAAVAMTPTQLPALADSEFRLATNAAGNYTHLTGWPSTDRNFDYDVVSRSPASSTMTFVANDGSTLELEKVSGSGSVSGATWTGTQWGWGSPYATLRVRKLNSSGDPITGWSANFTLRRAAALTENVTIPTARLLDAANYDQSGSGVVTLPGVNFSRRDNSGNTTPSSNVTNNNVTYYSDTPSVCTVSGNQLTGIAAGDCTLRATYAAVGVNSPGDGDPVTFTLPDGFNERAACMINSIPDSTITSNQSDWNYYNSIACPTGYRQADFATASDPDGICNAPRGAVALPGQSHTPSYGVYHWSLLIVTSDYVVTYRRPMNSNLTPTYTPYQFLTGAPGVVSWQEQSDNTNNYQYSAERFPNIETNSGSGGINGLRAWQFDFDSALNSIDNNRIESICVLDS